MKHKFSGLNKEEVKDRLVKYGPNELKTIGQVSRLKILIRQIKKNYIVYFLLFAATLSFFVGKGITGYVILAVVLLVVLTGYVQEYRAEKAIEKLKSMILPVSTVIRSGVERQISTSQIVPGDILILRTGEKIPADCVVLSEKNLLVNEAVLTGEADELKKTAVKNIKSAKEKNRLFAGSFVVNGKCFAKVTATGMKTKFGKIAGLISGAEKSLPLQKKVNAISKYMALAGGFMAIVTSVIALSHTDMSKEAFIDVIILAIAIAVSAFPEGFPVVLITTLSVGAYNMAKKNAIVNRMSIIETLGETTVVCSDKTGTITKGEMTVRKILINNNYINVTGVGYTSSGSFLLKRKKIDNNNKKLLQLLMKIGVICNDAIISKADEKKLFQVVGSPTEASLLVMASKGGVYREDFNDESDIIPFSSERKMMSVLYQEGKRKSVYTKGAPDFVLKKCSHIQDENGVRKLKSDEKKKILVENKKLTSDCLRTLAMAYKETNKSIIEEDDLIFVGIAAMEDPPRDGIKSALVACKRAGIKVKMITGDDIDTALAVAKQIKLGTGRAMEGYEIDNLSDKDLLKAIKKTVVFARVKPKHKIRIVKALKEAGEIVTMTGDGVNDAPALKEAHIGVAMGKNGTDVSRSVADLTLKDDNFVTLIDAIREGRTIFNNIRKFVTYQLSCNSAELIILFVGVLLAPFLGWPIPLLLALQILFMNIVTDNFPAITLGLNKSSVDIMSEKPRKETHILTLQLFALLLFAGALMSFFVLFAFYFAYNILGQNVDNARTTALLLLIILEIAGAFNFRSFRKTTLTRSPFVNPYLMIASVFSLLATFIILYTPINNVFGTIPLPLADWIIAVAMGFIFILIFDILKKINYKIKFFKI